jgi:hypothetical protein
MSNGQEKLSWPRTPEDDPGVDVHLRGEDLHFQWGNTTIRRYHVGDGEFDHLLYRPVDNENGLVIFMTQPDVGDLTELLESMNFPSRIDPIPEDIVLNLYAGMQSDRMESSLAELDEE